MTRVRPSNTTEQRRGDVDSIWGTDSWNPQSIRLDNQAGREDREWTFGKLKSPDMLIYTNTQIVFWMLKQTMLVHMPCLPKHMSDVSHLYIQLFDGKADQQAQWKATTL